VYYSYIDASGSRLRKDPENFALTSVTINQSCLEYMNQKINKIKKKEFPEYDPNKIELHAKDMIQRNGFFKNIPITQIYQLLDKTFEFLSKPEVDYFLVASVIKKELMYESTGIEEWAYKFVLERINKNIEFLNKQNNTSEKCNLIIDTESERNFMISNRINRILKQGTEYSNLELINKDIAFLDSKSSNMLQITDCISYAIRKYHRKNTGNSQYIQKWENYYCSIKPRFRNKNNPLHIIGLKIFPEILTLTSKFCHENNVTTLTVLDKPQMYKTDYGKKFQCIVQCDDTKKSIMKLNINQTSKKMIQNILGDLDKLVGHMIYFEIIHTKKFGKSIEILTITKIKKNPSKSISLNALKYLSQTH